MSRPAYFLSRAEWNAAFRADERERELQRRLSWRCGPERAGKIMSGEDEAAEADLRSWRDIGARADPTSYPQERSGGS